MARGIINAAAGTGQLTPCGTCHRSMMSPKTADIASQVKTGGFGHRRVD
jgi:hypothetical protein